MAELSKDDQALDWLVRLQGADDSETQAAFETWLNAEPANAAAFERAVALWRDLGDAESLDAALDIVQAAPGNDNMVPARSRPTWLSPLWGLAAAACAAVVVFAVAQVSMRPGAGPEAVVYASDISGIHSETLADGSQLTLGPRSRVEMIISETVRTAALIEGEAFFDVASDAEHPFFVEAGTARVRVVGTQFEVQRGAGALRVSVREGVVEVMVEDRAMQRLTAGDRLLVSEAGIERSRIDTEAVGSWRNGRLVYRQMPLDIIAADLGRYLTQGGLQVASDVGDVRVTATFETGEIEGAIEALALANGLSLQRLPDGDLLLTNGQ